MFSLLSLLLRGQRLGPRLGCFLFTFLEQHLVSLLAKLRNIPFGNLLVPDPRLCQAVYSGPVKCQN